MTRRGLSASRLSGPRPQRSKVPGLKLSISTSASTTSRRSSSAPRRSESWSVTPLLFRFTNCHHRLTPDLLHPRPRKASPRGCSTLMTSAPWSARSVAASGPANREAASSTRKPCRAPAGSESFPHGDEREPPPAPSSVGIRHQQLLSRKAGQHHRAVTRAHHLLLDPCRRTPVLSRAEGLEREDHPLSQLDRMLERIEPADHWSLVNAEPDPVTELQSEGLELAAETELLSGGPQGGDLVGRHPGLDHRDRRVDPLPRPAVGVALAGRLAPDGEGPVVAGAVAVVGMDDVEVGLISRPDDAVREDVRVGAAAFAGDRVDALDVLRAEGVEGVVGERHDVALPHSGLQPLEDLLVGGVDHRGGLVEEDDLVDRLDLPREQHRLLTVHHRHAETLEGPKQGDVDDVDPERLTNRPFGSQYLDHLGGGALGEAGLEPDGAAESGIAAAAVRRVDPGATESVRHGGRTEVPDPRLAGTGDEGVPLELVERPVSDVGGRHVAD